MILADTAAWVEFDRRTGSPVHRRLRDLIPSTELAVTEPVVMEVVMGARSDERELALRRLLARFTLISCVPSVDFLAAGQAYRRCRRRGITPRGPVDCLIAVVARRAGAALLTTDRDLARMAEVIGLRLDPASTA